MIFKQHDVGHPLISIIDDDPSFRTSTRRLIGTFGLQADTFESAQEFLSSGHLAETECLILDLQMPGMKRPRTATSPFRNQVRLPIVFVTAQANDTAQQRALRAGAVDFLHKPVSERALIGAIRAAFRKARQDESNIQQFDVNKSHQPGGTS